MPCNYGYIIYILSGQKTFPKLRFKDAAKTVGRAAVLSRKKMDIADVWLKEAAVSVCVCVCVCECASGRVCMNVSE